MKRGLDDLLRDTLRARAADPDAACLDADAAAALIDGAISARARAEAEAHLADCPRCRSLLAAMVRVTPPPSPRAWWRRPAIAWLVPLGAAAAAVAIWINVTDGVSLAPAPSVADNASPVAAAPIVSTPATTPEPQPQPLRDSATLRAPASESARARVTAAPAAEARSARVAPRAVADALAARQETSPPAAPAPALPAPPATAAPAAAPAAVPLRRTQTAESAAPAQSTDQAAAGAVPSEPAEPSALAETLRTTVSSLARSPTIVSSNRASQWRIRAAGEVQHSADGGATWQTQSTGANVTAAAGSSPSPSVCWLVGPEGTVLVTSDEGRSWRRVPFPIAIDLVSVRAADDRNATVVASDGRSFMTSDGGRSWRP